jgi:hypothetical protein
VRSVLLHSIAIPMIVSCALAQEANHNEGPSHNMDMSGQEQSAQVMHSMYMEGSPSWLPSFHAASGSNWQPASVPAHLWMTRKGNWDLMAHGTLFLTYNQQGGPVGKAKPSQ